MADENKPSTEQRIESLLTRLESQQQPAGAAAAAPAASGQPAPTSAAPDRLDRLMEVVERLATHVASQPAAQPAEAQRPPASAPTAPSMAALPMQQGLIDIFACSPAQLQQLGAQGVREVLDKLATIGAQRQGVPNRPKPPGK